MSTLPKKSMSGKEYWALPQHTEKTLPPLDTLPDGFKCRNAGGLVCELVPHDQLFANQVSLLSAPKRGFRYFQAEIIECPEDIALARVELAEKALALAKEELERVRKASMLKLGA